MVDVGADDILELLVLSKIKSDTACLCQNIKVVVEMWLKSCRSCTFGFRGRIKVTVLEQEKTEGHDSFGMESSA